MPTIRVDPDVFEGLQKLAQPFVDSPSMVIRRLLEERGLLPKHAGEVAPVRRPCWCIREATSILREGRIW